MRPSKRTLLRGALLIKVLLVIGLWWWYRATPASWSADELALLRTLHISALPALPPDPSNAVADSPQAARLGHMLFFDTRLSKDGTVACASCHQPDKRFTDGLVTARALGSSARNTPSLVGVAYSPWYYWDGRKDSQWAQALAPMEDPAEHGTNRIRLARVIAQDARYRELYEELFGALPDLSNPAQFPLDGAPLADAQLHAAWDGMRKEDQHLVDEVFANIGKALAAYQRKLLPGPTRFDVYVSALSNTSDASGALTQDEVAGLRLFIGKGRCLECHNGPLFTNNEFHNTGLLPPPGSVPDQGRTKAIALLKADPFNCLGAFSDAEPSQCVELKFMRSGVTELVGAMRTPSLRNLGGTAPYMHKGQLPNLSAVLAHYNAAPLALIGHNEAEPLGLGARELRQLEAFLLTLDAPLASDPQWLAAPSAE
jgi:cytochrome c peroxidase